MPATFLPGFSAGLSVTVTPPTAGVHTATLMLQSNAPDTPQTTVGLTIEGLDPEQPILDVTENRVEFPTVTVGETAQAALSLINRGRAGLTYNASVQGEGFGIVSAASLSAEGARQAGVALGPSEQDELMLFRLNSARR